MAKVLFVHNNFPGRFGFLLRALLARGHEVAAIAPGGREVAGVRLLRWTSERRPTEATFDLARRFELDTIRGRAAAEQMLALRRDGFAPELVVGHPGWGETTFIKEVFPQARFICQGEFYYHSRGADVGFDPEFGPITQDHAFAVHARNAAMALSYAEADRIVCPTAFQASTLPAAFRDRALVIHEGIETERVKHYPEARVTLASGAVLDRTVPVITFINRHFEPLRGFPTMMRALPKILAEDPRIHVLMIGSDEPGGYGRRAPAGKTWKQAMLEEVHKGLDPARVHFTGIVPYETMIAAMSISAAHVYYTYPFVLSWSLLEAMACECLVLGSNTPPLWDAIEPGRNGILNDFFDPDALADTALAACRDRDRFAPLREAARRTVIERYDRNTICLPAWLALVEETLAGRG